MADDAGDAGGLQSLSPQTPAEPAEPETAEAAVGDGAAAEPEAVEGPADGGAAAEAAPEEPGAPAEPEAAPDDAEPGEQPSRPVSEAGSEGPREEAAEAPAAPRLSPPPAGEEEPAAAQPPEVASGDEREASEGRSPEGSRARSAEELRGGAGREGEWSEEVRKQQEQKLRAELLEQYRALLVERSRYQRHNVHLQHKIHDALRRKKGLDAAEAPDKAPEPEAPEKEQVYLRYLAALEELKKQQADDLDWFRQELIQLKKQCQEKVARVEKAWRAFQALKKQVVLQAMGSCRLRGGRQAALREVEQIQALEDKKEKEMSAVRLENVQLKQSLAHFETRMRTQGDLTEGLLLIDFEQLKIENQTFNEKVEERNEELLKLRNKVINNVQIITHVKEKLHFVEMENMCKKSQVLEMEARVAQKRDILTKTKQARDSLRMDNIRLNQKCGLLGKELLLQDMEEKVEKTELLNQRLESLKRHHAGLALSCRGVKQKIREAKAFLPS
ncbi:coiled-coil domain-containing protein 96 [Elephas maximus indicus]|uniref:coiled-coil domain-containing protein 96 n=1 Tax=Elephas maximus indicus TaxID=99487 RepID=UPI002116C487|nr:coiled-coil domain-containing protein 96 [Elephas maximus indicus]